MYCPRCGHQPISNELRFCSYCGFRLGIVKAALADDEEVPTVGPSDTRVLPGEPRQRDVNLGVILMFAGAMLATFMAGRGGPGLGREGGAVILAAFFSSILLFARPIMKVIYKLLSWEDLPAHSSESRRSMGFGATLMFTSTILLAITSLLMFGRMRTLPFFFGLVVAVALLLIISKRLMRALQYLVTGEAGVANRPRLDVAHDPTSGISAVFGGPALPSEQDLPMSVFNPQRVKTAEIVSPPSITEQTTNLLENK